jgi:hypothetical protein
MAKRIISSNPNLAGLWTIPVIDLIRMIRKSGTPLPDWMNEDVVVSVRADAHGVTFVGQRVDIDSPPVLFENLIHQGKDGRP